MSEFKVGDRVRYACEYGFCEPGEGVIARIDAAWRHGDPWYEIDGVTSAATGDPDIGCFLSRELTLLAPDSGDLTLGLNEAAPANDYHARKFDKGKRDYTLLPAATVAAILDEEDAMRKNPRCEDDAEALANVVARLMYYRSIGDVEHLFAAYVCAAGDSVVESLDSVVEVLEHGAAKYARDSWMTVPNALDRYFSAAMRHANKIAKGETHDPDSKLGHWGHLRTNLMFVAALHGRAVAK